MDARSNVTSAAAPVASPANDRVTLVAGWVSLFAATLLTYLPALGAGFIWNDRDYVTAPVLQSLDGLRRIWFEVGATEQYYPVLHSFFWVQHRLWGDNPAGYHILNVLLHAGCAGMLVVVLRQLRVRGAWLAGFIFALHPVYVESVAWISEQKNTLSTLLYLVTASVYLRYDATRRPRLYWAALALFVVALLSKTVTATLPPALLVVFWWQRGRLEWRRDVVPLLPWFGLGAAIGIFSAWVEHDLIGAYGTDFALSRVQRALIAGRAAWFYLGKLLWPANLIFIYPRWRVDPAEAWQYLFPIATVLALVVLWRLRHQTRAPLAAILFFGGSLFPILGFFNIYAFVFSFVADHWQYQPSIGIVVLGSAAISALIAARPLARWLVPVALVGSLGALSFFQSRMYRDIETFYRTTIARNPACWMAYNNLGELLFMRGQIDDAIANYHRSLRIRPHSAEAHNNLATALAKIPGRFEDALGHYQEAIRIEPRMAEAHANLGVELARVSGRLEEAVAHLEKAVELKPGLAAAHWNLGHVLTQIPERRPDALASLERALQLAPNNASFHNSYAAELARVPGREADAVRHYETALRLDPAFAAAHNNLGNLLARLPGRMPDALTHYARALEIAPDFAAAHHNLGSKLASFPERRAEAITHLETAIRIDPNLAVSRLTLANELAKEPRRLGEAIEQYLAVLQIEPATAEARRNLARAYASAGQRAEAIAHLERLIAESPADSEARQLLSELTSARQ